MANVISDETIEYVGILAKLSLSPQEKEEASASIRNGINFARKVLVTGECDILILDEILGILDEGIITCRELIALINQARQSSVELILTGTNCPEELRGEVDEITVLETYPGRF